jgi:hypothetical protein
MSWFPSADRAATIAASMVVDGPGTIGVQHPARTFLIFAMQSRLWPAAEKSRRRVLQV